MSDELLLGKTTSSTIRYVNEDADARFSRVDVAVESRDWDVTSAEARNEAARAELGERAFDYHCAHSTAQWFINSELNAAALCVYRTKA